MFSNCRNSQPFLFGEDYEKLFDVQQYLQSYTDLSPIRCFPLKDLHDLFTELKTAPESLSVVDIGTGPCIAYLISAAPYASKIVLAEYTASNRAALSAWLENQKDAYDWMPYFKKVVIDLEGKHGTEVERRVAMVREKVKVSCHVISQKTHPCFRPV